MGFRELSKFNDSLLAKQIWRLATCENTLLCKVFKPKFFPNYSVLDCHSFTKGSYAWKSIIQARHLIDSRLCWRIGDGNLVCIREDTWLPKMPTARIISPAGSLPQACKASELIDG